MQGLATGPGVLHGLDINAVLEEFSVPDFLAHFWQYLKHHAAGADVGVAHLGIAHLPLGQTYIQPGGGKPAAGVLGKELIQIWRFGLSDGVAGAGRCQAIAIQNNKNCFISH